MAARGGHSGFKKLLQVPPPFQDVEEWGWGGAWGAWLGLRWGPEVKSHRSFWQRQMLNLGRAGLHLAGTAAQPRVVKQFGGR